MAVEMEAETLYMTAARSGKNALAICTVIIKKKTGEYVKKGETVATLYTNKSDELNTASEKYLKALTVCDVRPSKKPLIYKIIR